MARRRRAFGKARISSRAARYVRRGTRTSNAQLFQVDAMLYGAVRAPLSNFVGNIAGNFLGGVVGSLGDEVAVGLVDWLIAKNTNGMIRDVAAKGLVIENARVGEAIAQGALNNFAGSTPVAAGNAGIYGV